MLKILALLIVQSTLCISSAYAQTSFQDIFIPAGHYGEIPYSKLKLLADKMEEVGRADYFERTYEILKKEKLSELTENFKTCKMQGHTQGYYSQSYNTTTGGYYFNKLFSDSWNENTIDILNESFHSIIIKKPVYQTLVMFNQPIICLKPGLTLFKTLTILAHEFDHFFDSERKVSNYLDYNNFEDYTEQRLNGPGGELRAFREQMEFEEQLSEYTGLRFPNPMQDFFSYGYMIDREGFETFVLNRLNYRDIFSREYEELRQKSVQTISWEDQTTQQLMNTYQNNMDIAASNMAVMERNREIYLSSGRSQKAQAAKEQFERYEQEMIFYQELLEKIERETN
ncbi:MAG: hypothetical protein CME62_14685 [Halobacteriovoraceae bacterium]|nr:hypothetical protein [Halobacteriovoraceae bacterium]|tara:strand:- start:4631 stop:5653 length:1023 start_codon:yes stop_codon:yes gene_type:complete